jgi:D-glycero-alpha-D-manno-heptose-7-phosphate kinase
MRISLGGGATDIISYSTKFGGFSITGAIDKYVYVAIHRTFEEEIILKYSEYEKKIGVDIFKC